MIGDINGILLNSIKVYGVNNTLQLGNVITQETNFYIRIINGKMGIYPVTPYYSYCLFAERVINTTKVVMEPLDFNNSRSLLRKKEVRIKVFSESLPKTNSNPKMPSVHTSNGKNCRDCGKANVCKYKEIVTDEVERLIGELKDKELPLSVNINCNEFLHKNSGNVR